MDRFWSKVNKTDGCWEWSACRQKNGYGRFKVKVGKVALAHRFSYELTRGPIPKGLDLDHLCRNRACVRPDHLEAVTRKINVSRGLVIGSTWNCNEKSAKARLTLEEVKEIRRRYDAGGISIAKLAKEYGMSNNAMFCVVSRKTWVHTE